MLRNANQTTRSNSIEVQWYFVALVTAAIAISYFDRQTLPVAISAIQRTIPLSDQQFSWLQFAFLIPYAAMYAAGGRMLDIVGTRRGFILIMLWWSVAALLHSFATGAISLGMFRFLLGIGEAGNWPAGVKVATEWFPESERALASAAVRAVRQWRYAPPQVDGHTVEAETHVTISFLGDDAVSIILPPSR